MANGNGGSTFRILLVIIIFVIGLVIAATYFGDKTIQYCYGGITIVDDNVGCPTPAPERTR
jgi:hypothetical protein